MVINESQMNSALNASILMIEAAIVCAVTAKSS